MPPITGARMIHGPQGPVGGEEIRVVGERELAEEEEIVDQADQRAEENRADAGDDADGNGEKR
jgi:hypothetical protein